MTLRNITTSRGCFVVAGPRSREVMAKLTDAPLDNAAFPWLTGKVAEVGLATDVYLLRVNFVGALGWELHFPIEYAHHLFDAIFAAGAELKSAWRACAPWNRCGSRNPTACGART